MRRVDVVSRRIVQMAGIADPDAFAAQPQRAEAAWDVRRLCGRGAWLEPAPAVLR